MAPCRPAQAYVDVVDVALAPTFAAASPAVAVNWKKRILVLCARALGVSGAFNIDFVAGLLNQDLMSPLALAEIAVVADLTLPESALSLLRLARVARPRTAAEVTSARKGEYISPPPRLRHAPHPRGPSRRRQPIRTQRQQREHRPHVPKQEPQQPSTAAAEQQAGRWSSRRDAGLLIVLSKTVNCLAQPLPSRATSAQDAQRTP